MVLYLDIVHIFVWYVSFSDSRLVLAYRDHMVYLNENVLSIKIHGLINFLIPSLILVVEPIEERASNGVFI